MDMMMMTWHALGSRRGPKSSPGKAGGTERLIRRMLKCPKLYTRRNSNRAPPMVVVVVVVVVVVYWLSCQ
jgi:hypothetical protein